MEGLDEEIKARRKIQTDLELAKADREQLLNHYERERELRRKAEERHLNVEDELDLDKTALRGKLEELERQTKYLESRAQNYDDLSRKATENEDNMRLKYADLAKRHDETLAKYLGVAEENKILKKFAQTSTPNKDVTKAPFRSSHVASPSTEVYNITIDGSDKSFDGRFADEFETARPAPSFARSLNEELKIADIKKEGSDSSSEIPEDLKGRYS